ADSLPVENVSRADAVLFCNKLSEREKRSPYYRIEGQTITIIGGDGYRLPTEEEWEYACRANTTSVYWFGNNRADLDSHAWHIRNSGNKTRPVGGKGTNPWGFYDITGNVWELCENGRIRGGSWFNAPQDCRSAAFLEGGTPESHVGFRVAAYQAR